MCKISVMRTVTSYSWLQWACQKSYSYLDYHVHCSNSNRYIAHVSRKCVSTKVSPVFQGDCEGDANHAEDDSEYNIVKGYWGLPKCQTLSSAL
jgi:hypothetical protein